LTTLKREIFGVIPAVFTPFDGSGKVYEEAFREHVEHLLRTGVHGLFLCGTAGLGPLLTLDEWKTVVKLALEARSRDVPVLVNISSLRIQEVFEMVRFAERADVDAIVAITPYYYTKIDFEALVEYYSELASRTSLPIFVYNYPRATGINVDVRAFGRLKQKVPKILGIKDSSGNLFQISGLVREFASNTVILSGSDALSLSSLIIGVHGIVSAIANIVPSLIVEMYECCKKGDYYKGRALQMKVNELVSILKQYTQLSAYYEAISLMGRKFGTVKRPLRPLKREEMDRLFKDLSKLGFLE